MKYRKPSRFRGILRLLDLGLLLSFALLFSAGVEAYAQSCPECPSVCNESSCGTGNVLGPANFCDYPTTGCATGNPAQGGCCCIQSPIVVDVDGNGFRLTDATNGVHFSVGPTPATGYTVAWTDRDSTNAWLALDRNGNGTIDDITELFGNRTEQPTSTDPNGFRALAVFDSPAEGGNGDGVINQNDTIFSRLRLWQDRNHNGISESGELFALPSLDVAGFELRYRDSYRIDEHGNRFRYRAKVIRERGSDVARWAWDVFLKIRVSLRLRGK